MELLSKLGVQPMLLAAQIVNIGILVFVLVKLLYKPLMRLMEERTQRIDKGLRDAQAATEALANAQRSKEAMIAQAKTEAETLKAEIRMRAETEHRELITQTHEQTKKLVDDARVHAQEERKTIVEEASKDITNLVVLAAGAVLKKGITPEIDERLIAQTITALPSTKQ